MRHSVTIIILLLSLLIAPMSLLVAPARAQSVQLTQGVVAGGGGVSAQGPLRVEGTVGQGVGHAIVAALLARARALGLRRIFVLTFEEKFFARHGFAEIDGTPVPPDVFAAMLRSYDAGVAEFLDLAHVKPNTLGNVRMLLRL